MSNANRRGIIKSAHASDDGEYIIIETVNGASLVVPAGAVSGGYDDVLRRALAADQEFHANRKEADRTAAYGKALAIPFGADWSQMTQQQRRITANTAKAIERGAMSGEVPIPGSPGEILGENLMYEAAFAPLAPLAPKLALAGALTNVPRSYAEAIGQRRQLSRYLAKEAPIPYDYDAGAPASWPEPARQQALFQSLPRKATEAKPRSRPWVDVLGDLPASELGMSQSEWSPKIAGPEPPPWYQPPEPEPTVKLQPVPLTARPRLSLSRPLPEVLQGLSYGAKRGLGISNVLWP